MRDWVNFRAVRQAVSLEAVPRHYQVQGLHRRGSRLEGRCPIHQGKREDSFRASLAKNVFHCFVCQAGGNVLDFVAAMEKRPIREAALQLQRWFGLPEHGPSPIAGTRPVPASRKLELVREKERCNAPLRFTLTVDHSHPYLIERGVDRATAVEFGVGFCAAEGPMRGRIVIPIRNERGEIVAYAGRALDGRPSKYRLPAGFRKARELFNLYRAAGTGSNTVVVVEGYFDCVRVHQAGFPCVVALMGSSLSAEQERLMGERFERVVLMLDGDATGRAASQMISAKLSERCAVVVVGVPDGVQPDQLPPAVVQGLLLPLLGMTQQRSTLFETQLSRHVEGRSISGARFAAPNQEP